MKIIFLDLDGVICLATEWGGRVGKQRSWNRNFPERAVEHDCDLHLMDVEYRFDNFNEKAVRVLNQILEQTGAEIVLSSDWRFGCTLKEMQRLFELYGVIRGPIDYTPTLQAEDFRKLEEEGKKGYEDERSIEIKKWLSLHPETERWVAVDDLNMTEGLTNFVHTKRMNEGIKQSGIKEQILKFLC